MGFFQSLYCQSRWNLPYYKRDIFMQLHHYAKPVWYSYLGDFVHYCHCVVLSETFMYVWWLRNDGECRMGAEQNVWMYNVSN